MQYLYICVIVFVARRAHIRYICGAGGDHRLSKITIGCQGNFPLFTYIWIDVVCAIQEIVDFFKCRF